MMYHPFMNVADKIKKLLALAESSNPNEAALAAAKAQELMVKYAVEESEIAAKPGAVVEEIGVEAMGASSKGSAHWSAVLAEAMSRSFFCRVYRAPRVDIFIVGRKTDREAFRATWAHLSSEIDRMANGAYRRDLAPSCMRGATLAAYATKWKRGFSVGAAVTVKERLESSLKLLVADGSGTALVLANRQKDVDSYCEGNLQLGHGRAGKPVNASGFEEGKRAGWSLNLDKRAGASKRLAS
jgi:hypothetical protein